MASHQLRRTLFQAGADIVELLRTQPWRHQAPDPGTQFATPTVADNRRAISLLCFARAVFANIVREVAHCLVNPQQGLARSSLGVNHIMGFELDVKEFEFVMLFSRVERNRRAVDQACGRNQKVVEQQGVTLRHIEVGVRNVGGESRAGNPDRTRHLRPRLGRVAPDPTEPSDPLNRACSSEDGWHQVADGKIFDPALTRNRRNPGSPQETVASMGTTTAVRSARVAAIYTMSPIVTAMFMMSPTPIVTATFMMSPTPIVTATFMMSPTPIVTATLMMSPTPIVATTSVTSAIVAFLIAFMTGKCRLRRHYLHRDWDRRQQTNCFEISRQKRAAGSRSWLHCLFSDVGHVRLQK